MYSMLSGADITNSPLRRQLTRSSLRAALSSVFALAWAMVYFPSSIADR